MEQARRADALAAFFRTVGRLKETPRTGWLDRGVPPAEAESVADHSFRVALMAWLLAGDDLDRGRVLELALLHDLAEAATGDLTPYAPDDVPAGDEAARRAFLEQRHLPPPDRAAAKRRAENEAFARMTEPLPAPLRAELAMLWNELTERTTPEATFVKQIDRLETYLQSREYADRYPGLPVGSFAAEVAGGLADLGLCALRDAIAGGDQDARDQAGSGDASGSAPPPKSNRTSMMSPDAKEPLAE